MNLPAAYFHGSELFLAVFLAFTAILVLGVGLLSGWLVRKFRPKLGRKAYWLAVPLVVPTAVFVVWMWSG